MDGFNNSGLFTFGSVSAALRLSDRIENAVYRANAVIREIHDMADAGEDRWSEVDAAREKLFLATREAFGQDDSRFKESMNVIAMANREWLRADNDFGLPPSPMNLIFKTEITAHEAALTFATQVQEWCQISRNEVPANAKPVLKLFAELPDCETLLRNIRIERLPLKAWEDQAGNALFPKMPQPAALIDQIAADTGRKSSGEISPENLSPQQKRALRRRRVIALCRQHGLHRQWARLRNIANEDPEILSLGLRPLTDDAVYQMCKGRPKKSKTPKKTPKNRR